MRLEFTKMEGAGNDYIYVDAARFPIDDPSALAIRLSDRHFGIGADGLVLIGPSSVADYSMRIFNADGSEAQMCGNAARCIGKYLCDRGLTGKSLIELETSAGLKRLHVTKGADGRAESVTVGMGRAVIKEPALELEAAGERFCGTVVDVGNPHFVVLCPDADTVYLERLGPALERHPLFPERINVEFVSVVPPVSTSAPSAILSASPVIPSASEGSSLRMRVWERGSGVTLACGTGACASVAAAVAAGVVSSPCTVRADGGLLRVVCNDDGALLLKGPARFVFDGVIEV